ncbi:MAG TPA: DUF3168 domain-containing protein [Mesorhizobium sp.]|jgi:hypothetical protein|nr:DUF3168 domain-containing protein [Mesorhizobium sp.]
MSAARALQKAIWEALRGDAALTALIGPEKVFDRVPPHTGFPYVSFGRTSVADWSTATEEGAEHLVTLHAWSKDKGRAGVLAVLERVRARLGEGVSTAGHHLVNLTFLSVEAAFEDEAGVERGTIVFRAVTEPL